MKANKITRILALIMIITLLVPFTVNAEMFTAKASAIVIKNIADINVSLFLNEKFNLPSKVKAQMSNGKTVDQIVKWDKKSIATDKAGQYVSLGTVKGYAKKVKLTLTVNSPIKSLEDVNVTVRQGVTVTIPASVVANLTDGKKIYTAVTWSKKVDTSKIGTFIIEGTVKGFSNKAKIIVSVKPKIATIEQLEAKVSIGSSYTLPSKVQATLSNNEKDYVDVKWNTDVVDTSSMGIKIIEGSVEGYDSKVYLMINVSERTVQDIAKESRKVVLLYIYDKHGFKIASGSGFLVSEDGKVLTNFHVVDGASKIKAVNSDGDYVDVKGIYYYNKDEDLALLQLDSNKKFPYVQLGDSSALEQGDQIIAIGSPKGLQNSISEGIVSSLRKDIRSGYTDIQISAPISPGSSGGALFNMKGEVVGITYAMINGGENINFAIPINEAKAILNKTSTLSPISTIEKYDEETAYYGFENYLTEKYTYFWVGDTKVYIDGFDVYESKDGKTLYIDMLISDNDQHYADFKKAMDPDSPNKKEANKVAVQQFIYSPLKEGMDFFPDKTVALYFYSYVFRNSEPANGEFDYSYYDENAKKWVGYHLIVGCTVDKGQYYYKWF